MFNQEFFKNGAMIGLVILSIGYMLMSKMELNNQSLLSLLLFGGALMCVFNNKRKGVNSEACFLISIYLLSTLLAKFKGLREGFDEPSSTTSTLTLKVTPNADFKITGTEINNAYKDVYDPLDPDAKEKLDRGTGHTIGDIIPANAADATATATIDGGKVVVDFDSANGGTGYLPSGNTVTFTNVQGDPGSGAAATVTISETGSNKGQVTAINVNNVGSGYTNAPTVSVNRGYVKKDLVLTYGVTDGKFTITAKENTGIGYVLIKKEDGSTEPITITIKYTPFDREAYEANNRKKAVIAAFDENEALIALKENAAKIPGLETKITTLSKELNNLPAAKNYDEQLKNINSTLNKGFFENPKPTDIFIFVVACLYCLVLLAGATGSLIRNFSK